MFILADFVNCTTIIHSGLERISNEYIAAPGRRY